LILGGHAIRGADDEPVHRDPHPQRRPLWILGGAFVLVFAVVGTAGGLRVARQWAAGGDTRCAAQAGLRVTVDAEFAPLLRAAVTDLPVPASGCPPVVLTVREPAEALAALDTGSPPDGWVPSASAWLGMSTTAANYQVTEVSLARSPVVIAAPRPFAEGLGWPGHQPGWAEIAAKAATRQIPRISAPDPKRSTVGLLTALGVRAAMARTTPDDGIAQMRALTLRSRLADPTADPAALLARAAGSADATRALREVGLFPVTEHALWTYQRAGPKLPLAGLYPPDGLLEADYPLALSPAASADPVRRDLATHIGDWFRRAEATRLVVANGFRPSASTGPAAAAPSGAGLVARYPAAAQLAGSPADIQRTAVQWADYRRAPFQVLLLVDGSASMNGQIRDLTGKLTTKAQLLRRAGGQAAQLFGEDTSLAMWVFATPAPDSPPYQEVVPFGPLTGDVNGTPRRVLLAEAAQGFTAAPHAGTPLYEAVLRGTARMRQTYRPGAVSLVVVLTDGRDRDSRYATTRARFLAKLSAAQDAARPVPVFCIGYGPDADLATLTEIARLTGGRAVASGQPGDLAGAMARIFLAAHRTG
jgi:Mg-chelatase subunit ChlD